MDYLANSWIDFSWRYLLAYKNDGYGESGALVVAEQVSEVTDKQKSNSQASQSMWQPRSN